MTVWNDLTNLFVQYDTTDGWVMKETHLGICLSAFTSRPNPGHSPYKTEKQKMTTYLYTIPSNAIKLHPDWSTAPVSSPSTRRGLQRGPLIASPAEVDPRKAGLHRKLTYGGDCYRSDHQAWYCQIAYTICCESTGPPLPPGHL